MRHFTSICQGLLAILLLSMLGRAWTFAVQPAKPPTAPRILVTNVVSLRARVGQEVTVYGRVSRTGRSGSGHQFLNFQNTELTVICMAPDVAKFTAGEPAEVYRGKNVEVSGRLERYRDKLQIRLRGPARIRIEEPRVQRNVKRVQLQRFGRDAWRSPAGLVYKGHDAEGLTRVEHVKRHARDIPDRDGPHGVFDGGPDVAFAIIDEAWGIAKKKRLKPRVEGAHSLYEVPMGRRVGFLGGRLGARRNHPSSSWVRIVFETGTRNIVTAFPSR